jgi:hypothetical protein
MAARHPRPWRRTLLGLAVVSAAYVLFLLHPGFAFAHAARDGGILLHAREPLPPEASLILGSARRRVESSPFYDPADTYDVFLCDSTPLYAAFALWNYKTGGLSQWALGGNVFLRPAHVARDRLVRMSGAEVPGDRTLTYFIAHEVTHTMLARRIGRRAYHRLRAWQVEGYADYVGKGGSFDYEGNLKAFRARARDLEPRQSGLYLRHHLYVAHLLDRRGMTPEELVAGPIDPRLLESELRGGS